MKNLIFEIGHLNYGMIKQGDWSGTHYKIYDDLSMDLTTKYVGRNEIPNYRTISEEDYKKLIDLMENAVIIDQKVEATDGDAWESKYYKNNAIYWKRDADYIYGIQTLETIAKILENYN